MGILTLNHRDIGSTTHQTWNIGSMVSWVCLEMAYLMAISFPNEIAMIGVPPILAQTSDIHNWHEGMNHQKGRIHIYIYMYIYIHTHTNMYTVLYIVQEDYVFLFMGIPLDSWIWELEDYVFFNPGMVTDMHKVKTAWLFCVMVNKQLRSFSYTPKFYTTTLWYVYVWGKSAINI